MYRTIIILHHHLKLCFIFLEGDPDNYLTYFKRGTVYLALGKAKFALIDFGKVLELKPDFTAVSDLNYYFYVNSKT